MNQFRLKVDLDTLAAARVVGFHTLADRCNIFYTFFILWLTGAMDPVYSYVLHETFIQKYKKISNLCDCRKSRGFHWFWVCVVSRGRPGQKSYDF